METAEKELTLEEAFLRLEEVTRALEDENISLEESFTVYQKGMELLKYCNESIDNCLLYTSPSPRDRTRSRMPSSA